MIKSSLPLFSLHHQRGVSLVETVIMLPILMLVGLGALQYALIYEAKSSLNYATFMAARAGALDHANPESLRIGFAKGLAPLYSPDGTAADLLLKQTEVGEDFQNNLIHLAILNPTTDAFTDFGRDLDDDGQEDDLPSLDLQHASAEVKSQSGVNIQDANLLKVHATYGAKLLVPFVGPLFARFAEATTNDPIRLAMLRQGRLPIIATATVRMQNHATRNDLMLSREEVESALQTALTPRPDPGAGAGGEGESGEGGDALSPIGDSPGDDGPGDEGDCNEATSEGCPSPVTPLPCDPNSQPCSEDGSPIGDMVCTAGSSVSNPIHVVTGNKYQVETDLAPLPGTLGIRFQRYYNSQDSASSAVGHGWRHSYSARLSLLKDQVLRITRDDGRAIYFEPDAPAPASEDGLIRASTRTASHWRARTRADGRIDYDAASQRYHWRQHSGHSTSFDQAGRLIGLRAPSGATVNLYYSRRGQLQQVVDPQQRKLSFNYYPNGRLKTLTDPAGQRTRYSYDSQGNLDYAVSLGDHASPLLNGQRQQRQYHYEDPHDSHNLTGITNARGVRYVSWAYDDQDRAISGTHAAGADQVSLDFSTPGQTLVTNSIGEQSVYHTTTIQGVPLVSAIDGPGCSTCGAADSQYVYDDNAQLIRSQTEKGLTSHYHYDVQGRLISSYIEDSTGAAHSQRTLSYQSDSLKPSQTRQASVNSAGQHQTQLSYNSAEQLIQIEETGYSPTPAGGFTPITRRTRLRYDGPDLIAIDGPRDDVEDILKLSYDSKHRLKTLTRPDGRELSISAYDAYGRPTQIQTGEQSPLHLRYNAKGQPTQVSQGPNTLSYEYSASGQLIALTGPDGERVDIRYDKADRASSIIQANGPQLSLAYDTESRLTNQRLSNANGDILSTVSLLYDAQGRLRQKRTNQNNNETLRDYQYDANDRLSTLSNGQGDQVKLNYNPLGQLLGINNGETDQAISSALAYDNKGQAISLTDANGNTTERLKDDFGRTVALISADTGTTWYEHDAAGNKTATINPLGQKDHYVYDAANRLINSQTEDGTTDYVYHNSNGQLTEVRQQTEQGQSQERFDYDKEGRLIRHHRDLQLVSDASNDTAPAQTKTLTTAYQYNAQGKLSHKHLADGQTLRYHYYQEGQHQGRIRAITKESFFGQDVIIGEIDPNHWDGTAGYVFGNGLKAQANYKNGQLKSQQDGKVKLIYEYDAAGNITQIDENGTLKQYRYDQLGRLATARIQQTTYRYQYDALGNRIARTVSSTPADQPDKASATQTEERKEVVSDLQFNDYQGEGNRLSTSNGQAIAYNEAGSPIEYPSKTGIRSYDYNAHQRPIRLYLDGELKAEYAYNAFGERIRKTVYPRKTQSNTDEDDESDQPTTTYYLYDGRKLSAEVNAQGKITQQYIYYQNAPIALLKGKTLYHIHSDHLGTPQAITDKKGKTQWQAKYSPFGQATINDDVDNNGKAITLNLRFAGQYEDAESGTYYNYFRDYDPQTGRYLTSDPIGLRGGINTYAYVGNNPLSNIDPLGLMVTGVGGATSQPNFNNIPQPDTDNTFLGNFSNVFGLAVAHIAEQGDQELADALSGLTDNLPLIIGSVGVFAAATLIPGAGQVLLAGAIIFVGFSVIQFLREVIDIAIEIERFTDLQNSNGMCFIDDPLQPTGERLARAVIRLGADLLVGTLVGTAGRLASQVSRRIRGANGRNVSDTADDVVSRVKQNQINGDAARDRIASRFPGAMREVPMQTSLGNRRIDVLTRDGLAIESKVGRTSLTQTIRTQILKDIELRNSSRSRVTSLRYEFSRSPVTGQVGPTAPLARFLRANNIEIVINN